MNKKNLFVTIIVLAFPAVLEMLFRTLLGFFDTLMIGRLISAASISSVGFVNTITYTIIFSFSAFNIGAVALVSRSFGEKNYKRLKKIASVNVTLNLCIGIVVSVLLFVFKTQIFLLFDLEDSVRADALAYFSVVLIGFVPMFLSFSFSSYFRGIGDTKTPMYLTLISIVFNIVCNYFFITGAWIFPQLGIRGAALATTLARFVQLFIYIALIYIKKSPRRLDFKFQIDTEILRPLFEISYPGAIEQFLIQLGIFIVGIFISSLPTRDESAFRMVLQIEAFSFMPAAGLSMAASTLVGKSIGEKDLDKAIQVGMLTLASAIGAGAVFGTVFFMFAAPFLSIFTGEQAVIDAGVSVLKIAAFTQPFLNTTMVLSGMLRGAGDTKRLMAYSLIRMWVFQTPLAYLFIITWKFGAAGMWMAEFCAYLLFIVLAYRRFKSKKWDREFF